MDEYTRLDLLTFVARGGPAYYVRKDLRDELYDLKVREGLDTFADAAKFLLEKGVQES